MKNTVLNAECFASRQIKAASWCVFTTSLHAGTLISARSSQHSSERLWGTELPVFSFKIGMGTFSHTRIS